MIQQDHFLSIAETARPSRHHLCPGISFARDPANQEENPMRWTPGEESPDIEDRRNEGGGGGGGGFGFGPRHLGIGGFVVLLILSVVFKRNFFSMLGGGSANTRQPVPIPGSQVAGAPAGAPANYDRTTQLV